MGRVAYHSSLSEPGKAKPRQRFTLGSSAAFVWDVSRGPHAAFGDCDLLYSEPAWEATFERFAKRAGVTATYADYIAGIRRVVDRATAPAILVVGRKALPHLPDPASRLEVNLNSGGSFIAEAVAVSFRCKIPRVGARHKDWVNVDTENLLRVLARQYDRVGDYCCGYGNTGRMFAEVGKSWVLADVNPQCIGYIAEHAKAWRQDVDR